LIFPLISIVYYQLKPFISVFPIPGCRSVARVEENAGSADVQLTPEDIKTIREAVDGTATVEKGQRYPEAILAACMVDCIPLDQWKGETA